MVGLEDKRIQRYTRAQVMSRSFSEELYLFDMTCHCEIVGARAAFSRLNIGSFPLEWLSEGDRDSVERYLMSYAEKPLLCESREQTLLFIPNLAPSSSLGIVMRLGLDAKDVIKLAEHCGFEIELSRDLLEKDRGRLGKKIKERRDVIDALAEDIRGCFGGRVRPRKLPRNMTERLIKRIDSLSYLTGCPISLDCDGQELVDYGDFDEGVFCAFLLLSMLLARRLAESRGVDVTLSKSDSLGITVSAEMSLVPDVKEMVPEIVTIRGIANRKNMFFDFSVTDGEVYMCIAPANKDWSYLELKHPDLFDWDN